MAFTPDFESLNAHEVPAWFHDAKFGIFIHWTIGSVPAFAPQHGSLPELIRDHAEDIQKYSPYAEWYWNTMKFPDSDTAAHHRATYGADYPYERFREPFEAAVDAWDPAPLADLIVASGARYVVFVTKHHDGFVLWPTATSNPHKPGWNTRRDLAGDIARAVRGRGLRFGVYYSGGLDWTFNPDPILNMREMFASVPRTPEYRAYVAAHYRELIDRYHPDVLWNDIAYPPGPELPALFAGFYNGNADGVVNDRWAQPGSERFPFPGHHDFRTPEYTQYADIRQRKWEATRGIGHSFAFVENEPLSNVITPQALIQSFVDAVSKNGNLLLNIGPRADGSVHPAHEVPLRAIGEWLAANGEAVYGTRPWTRAEGVATDAAGAAHPVRFTAKPDRCYAIVFDPFDAGTLRIAGLGGEPFSAVRLPGGAPLGHRVEGDALAVDIPHAAPGHALALELLP